jgi:hypothetical protein
MKRMCRLLTVGLLVTVLNNFVSATPSTQIWIPSTDVQGFGVIHLGWDSYIKTESNPTALEATPSGYGTTVTNGGITVGVLPFKKIGLEIGVDYRDISSNHQYPIYLNAKLGVPEDAFFKYQPAIAVGSFDLGTHYSGYATPTNYNVTYGLIAKNIWKLGRISVGYYMGNDNLLTDGSNNNKKDASGVLASWDRALTEISDKLWLAVDYQGAKNSYGAISFGGSYAVTPDASFIIGYDIWNDDKSYKPTATVQIDINLPAVQDWFKKVDKK